LFVEAARLVKNALRVARQAPVTAA
jgi:hypothetical protein